MVRTENGEDSHVFSVCSVNPFFAYAFWPTVNVEEAGAQTPAGMQQRA